jgi:hypothetical protein
MIKRFNQVHEDVHCNFWFVTKFNFCKQSFELNIVNRKSEHRKMTVSRAQRNQAYLTAFSEIQTIDRFYHI